MNRVESQIRFIASMLARRYFAAPPVLRTGLVVFLLTLSAAAYILLPIDLGEPDLGVHLKRWSPRGMTVCLLASLIAFLMSLGHFRALCSNLSASDYLGLAAVTAIGAVLVFTVPPRTHRMLFDEQIYEGVGLNWAMEGEAAVPTKVKIILGEYNAVESMYNKNPNAWPFLMGLAIKTFGAGQERLFTLNQLIFLIGAIAVFLIARLLYGDTFAATLSGLAFCVIPANLQWASTTTSENSVPYSRPCPCFAWCCLSCRGRRRCSPYARV